MANITPSMEPGQMQPYGVLPRPKLTPELLSLVRTGHVYSLAVVHHEGIPVPDPMGPYTLTPGCGMAISTRSLRLRQLPK